LQKEKWNLDFDELPIKFEKVVDYFEQTTLQKEDRNHDFDELSQCISNQYTMVEFEKKPDDLEPILLQREEREDLFIDFNDIETEETSDAFEPVLLKVDNRFADFNKAKYHVHKYVKYKGFEVCCEHIMSINGANNEKIIRKQTVICKHSGVYKPKNLEKSALWFNKCVNAFWQCHNANAPDVFEYYWNKLIIKYPKAKPYLKHRLYKSQNLCIKRVISNSNILLCDISKILIEHSEEERKHKLIEEWRCNIPNTTSVSTIFPIIESLVKKYLRPNISHFLIEQIKEIQKPLASDDFNDEYVSAVICAKYLLEHLENNAIEEVWNVLCVTSQRNNHVVFLLVDGL
ncbi:23498_t:CDS:2, partial [Gigaspora rosea]